MENIILTKHQERLVDFKFIKPTIKFASLFAGGGGSSLGYQNAGLHEILAIEWDKHAREVFKLNFPNTPVYDSDISKITGDELLNILKMQKGELDVFDASPPCQGFSTSNTNRDPSDDRNNLYFKTLDLIHEIQPKLFVIENVDGMKKGKLKKVWNKIVRKLNTLNYNVEFKIIKAEEYGVPQIRRRLILIGLRNDIYHKFNITGMFPKPNKDQVQSLALGKVIQNVIGYSPGQFADRFKPSTDPMCTITKTASAWLYDSNGFRRKPTIEELKIISSFPKEYKLTGSYTAQWARIGNAVPPNITKAIGEHIKNHILTLEVLDWCNNQEESNQYQLAA